MNQPDSALESPNESLDDESNDSEPLFEEPFVPTNEPSGEGPNDVESPSIDNNSPRNELGKPSSTSPRNGPRDVTRNALGETRQHFVRACWPHKLAKTSSPKSTHKKRSYEYIPTQTTTRSGRTVKPVTRFSSHRYN